MQSLEGVWYNQLGSRMDITSATNNQLSGTYESGVGCAQGPYTLTGRYETEGKSLGWVVSWKNNQAACYSTTSWSGEYDTACVAEEIRTTWLLTYPPAEDWNSTTTGVDTFTRTQPTAEACKKALKRGCISQPRSKKTQKK